MSDQATSSRRIQEGDTVAFNPSYIEHDSPCRDRIINARARVTTVHRIANGAVLADLIWDTEGLSTRVYVKYLVKA
jgi:hypothetical protein